MILDTTEPRRIERREAVKWMLTAVAALSLSRVPGFAADGHIVQMGTKGYGTDPELLKSYQPGEFWPLTLSEDQRKTVAALCDTVIPADADSPSASQVGVHDFIDEWISAPYPSHADTRILVLDGIAWLDAEAKKRYRRTFVALNQRLRDSICHDICKLPASAPEYEQASAFFKTFRDLTAGGYYSTPEGMRAVGYIGNVAIATFDGPPAELIKKLGLE